jgi:hypothetical protein
VDFDPELDIDAGDIGRGIVFSRSKNGSEGGCCEVEGCGGESGEKISSSGELNGN